MEFYSEFCSECNKTADSCDQFGCDSSQVLKMWDPKFNTWTTVFDWENEFNKKDQEDYKKWMEMERLQDEDDKLWAAEYSAEESEEPEYYDLPDYEEPSFDPEADAELAYIERIHGEREEEGLEHDLALYFADHYGDRNNQLTEEERQEMEYLIKQVQWLLL